MKLTKFCSVLAIIFSLLFWTTDLMAQESGLRLGAGMGVGVLVAGDEHITGGFSLSPSVIVGYKGELIGISYQNLPNVNTFRKIENAGLLDQNSVMLTIRPHKNIFIDSGPSIDFFSMYMCSNDNRCARQTGFALGGHLRIAVVGKIMSIGTGIVANAHLSFSPSRLYNGVIFTSNVGPLWEF